MVGTWLGTESVEGGTATVVNRLSHYVAGTNFTLQSVFSSISLIQNLDLSTQNRTLDPLSLHVLVVQISQFELSTLLKPNSLLPPDCKFEH